MLSRTVVIGPYVEFIYCGCGCGFTRPKYAMSKDRELKTRPAKYIEGHHNIGKTYSEETKKKMSKTLKGINNPMYGRKQSEETRIKMSLAHKGKKINESHKRILIESTSGENNHLWKGDNVGYKALHMWIRKYLPKPEDGLCELCHLVPFREAACITSIYNRDFKNWAWFCARCHMRWDNQGRRRRSKRVTY